MNEILTTGRPPTGILKWRPTAERTSGFLSPKYSMKYITKLRHQTGGAGLIPFPAIFLMII